MARDRGELVIDVLAAVLGGVAGVVGTQLLQRVGVKPEVAALGVAVVGAVGVAATNGRVRQFAVGAAAAGTGQLAQRWFAALDRRLARNDAKAELGPTGAELRRAA